MTKVYKRPALNVPYLERAIHNSKNPHASYWPKVFVNRFNRNCRVRNTITVLKYYKVSSPGLSPFEKSWFFVNKAFALYIVVILYTLTEINLKEKNLSILQNSHMFITFCFCITAAPQLFLKPFKGSHMNRPVAKWQHLHAN